MKEVRVTTPISEEDVRDLEAGDIIYLTGTIHTSRDKAHKRMLEYAGEGKKPPFDIDGGIIYHCGPLARKKDSGWEILSAGPTTSARMDEMTPEVIEKYGIRAIIGKGGMDEGVRKALKKFGSIYLAYTGGAGALAAGKIEDVVDVFWLELGMAEAVWVFEVKDFGPLVVAMDAKGGILYAQVSQKVNNNLKAVI